MDSWRVQLYACIIYGKCSFHLSSSLSVSVRNIPAQQDCGYCNPAQQDYIEGGMGMFVSVRPLPGVQGCGTGCSQTRVLDHGGDDLDNPDKVCSRCIAVQLQFVLIYFWLGKPEQIG